MSALVGPYTQDTHDLLGLVRQRIVNSLGKRGMVVRRVVIDEQDFVVGVGHHLGKRIEADRRPLMEIVAVAVVTAVKDDGKHMVLVSPAASRPEPGQLMAGGGMFDQPRRAPFD